jgi:hypothetical protein
MSSDISTLAYYSPENSYPGFITEGFGSGFSPSPYAIDPFNALTERARLRKEATVVDGYFSECVLLSPFLPVFLVVLTSSLSRSNATAGFETIVNYPECAFSLPFLLPFPRVDASLFHRQRHFPRLQALLCLDSRSLRHRARW